MAMMFMVALEASPVMWSRSQARPEPAASTLIPWPGHIKVPGAFLISRVNLDFIPQTCQKFIESLEAAIDVAKILEKNQLQGSSSNQQKRYGYTLIRLEAEFKQTLYYIHDAVLCSGRGGELWSNFKKLRDQLSTVWTYLKKHGVSQRFAGNTNSTMEDQLDLPNNSSGEVQLIDLLFEGRSQMKVTNRKPRGLFLLGAGLGLLGAVIADKIFGQDSATQIATLNKNIQTNNKMIKISNSRIDILSKNVSESHEIIKSVLEKLNKQSHHQDLHMSIQWNFDQLVSINTEIQNTFRLAEMTLTLLDNDILNPDLLQLNSLKKIIKEGLELFPDLSFPLTVNRYHLYNIVQIIKVQRVGKLKFLMILPLAEAQVYKIFTIIPHPMTISETILAMPKVKQVILTSNKDTYILTDRQNIKTISTHEHMLLEVEPIYNQAFTTCEWAVFNNRPKEIISLCDFEKAGTTNDTVVIETDRSRLIYFHIEKKVELNCPEKKISTRMKGLHNISLTCDITTSQLHWPSKQTATININTNAPQTFHDTELPIASINDTSDVHNSIKELIDKLPKKGEAYTFDFDYYNLTLEEVQTYTVLSSMVISIIVIINSLLLGFLFFKLKSDREQRHQRGEAFSLGESFRKLGDSIRARKSQLGRDRFRHLRHSLRSQGSSLRGKFRNMIPKPRELQDKKTGTDENTGTMNSAESITEPPAYPPQLYPAIPRYRSYAK